MVEVLRWAREVDSPWRQAVAFRSLQENVYPWIEIPQEE